MDTTRKVLFLVEVMLGFAYDNHDKDCDEDEDEDKDCDEDGDEDEDDPSQIDFLVI